MTTPTGNGIFDLILGLPVHPLVVHAAVVLLPLGALAVIALFAVKRWRVPLAWPTLGLLVVATIAAFIARTSGGHLEDRVGDPGQHAQWGGLLPFVATGFLVIAGAWLVLVARRREGSGPITALGAVAALAAVGVIGLTVVTGHSGSEAAWQQKIARSVASEETSGSQEQASPDESATTAASPSEAATDAAYPMTEVRQNATAESCWAAVDGQVYDLTSWIARHPGGEQRILNLCGTDATSAFTGKHGDAAAPNTRLDSLRIGTLAD